VKVLASSIGPNSGLMSPPVLEPKGAIAVTLVLVVVGIAAGLPRRCGSRGRRTRPKRPRRTNRCGSAARAG
jgi:hypothetical protein